MTDRLRALVVSEEDLTRDELASALEGRVRFTQEGDLILEDGFASLTTTQKVACVLLACRAGQILGLRESNGATPAQVVAMSGMAPGSVRPKLSQLSKERLLTKYGGAYVVPIHAARRLAAMVRDGGRR